MTQETDKRPRVLVIDDDRNFLSVMETRLQAEGFAVVLAPTGKEGLAASTEATFDLILLDMIMPEQDGMQTYQALRAQPATRRVPVILMTGMAAEGYWEALPYDTDGPCFVMGKPFEVPVLLARISQLLTRVRDR